MTVAVPLERDEYVIRKPNVTGDGRRVVLRIAQLNDSDANGIIYSVDLSDPSQRHRLVEGGADPSDRAGATRSSWLTGILTSGQNSCMKAVKVTSKGQITIPLEIRDALGIDRDTYLEVIEVGSEIRLRRIVPVEPLSDGDPIWGLVGAGDSGRRDVSSAHDRHLADAEIERWRTSS